MSNLKVFIRSNMKNKKITIIITAFVITLFTPVIAYASEFSPATGDDRQTPWIWAIAIIAAVVILIYFAISAIRRKSSEKRRKRRR